jgi:F-type H+-transporting ATPase subunit epsilon
LPHRLDCTAALAPGILSYETEADGEVYLATDLDKLHEAVKREFLDVDQQEKNVRSVLAKMESGFIRRFMELQHD